MSVWVHPPEINSVSLTVEAARYSEASKKLWCSSV